MKTIDIKRLRKFRSVDEALKYYYSKDVLPPEKPKKPNFEKALKSDNYDEIYKKYYSDLATYRNNFALYEVIKQNNYNEITEYLKEQAGLYNVPKKYREKIWDFSCKNFDNLKNIYIFAKDLVQNIFN